MNLTRAQIAGMRRIRDHGSGAWYKGAGRGDALSRALGCLELFDGLVAAGLVYGPPYKLTAKGLVALAALEDGEP